MNSHTLGDPAKQTEAIQELISTPLAELPFAAVVIGLDRNLTIEAASTAFYEMFGVTDHDGFVDICGGSVCSLLHGDSLEAVRTMIHAAAAGETPDGVLFRTPSEGRTIRIVSHGKRLTRTGAVVLCTCEDGAYLRQLGERLEYEEQRAEQIALLTMQLVFEYDIKSGKITNSAIWAARLGQFGDVNDYTKALVSKGYIHKDDADTLDLFFDKLREGIAPESVRLRFRFTGENFIYSTLSGAIIRDAFGTPCVYICTISPNSVEEASERLLTPSELDPLTGFYGKFATEKLLIDYLSSQSAPSGTLILIGFDRFSELNQSRGRIFGDMILRETAELIRHNLSPDDLLGRYSGAIIAAFCPGTVTAEAAARQTASLRSAINRRFNVHDTGFSLDCHTGYAVLSGGNESAGELFRRADFELHHSKSDDNRKYRLI